MQIRAAELEKTLLGRMRGHGMVRQKDNAEAQRDKVSTWVLLSTEKDSERWYIWARMAARC